MSRPAPPENNLPSDVLATTAPLIIPSMTTTTTQPSPKVFLLLENPRKSNNLGPILRCAAALGVSQVVAVGVVKCSTHGSHGAAKHVPMIAFPNMDQALSYLCNDDHGGGGGNCKSVVGLLGGVPNAYESSGYRVAEKDETDHVSFDDTSSFSSSTNGETKWSFPIHSRPFIEGNCCFVLGHKTCRGLPSRLGRHCDFFVHVPHVNISDGDETKDDMTESSARLLDLPSCLSICLHHYTAWAHYDERGVQGHKYKVEVAPLHRNAIEEDAARLARALARREQQEESESAMMVNHNVKEMFGDQDSGDY